MRQIVIIFLCFISLIGRASDTKIKYFRPFMPQIISALQLTTVSGHCIKGSQRIKREDAWYCIAEGKAYDPCFIANYEEKGQAVCIDNPWSLAAVIILFDDKLIGLANEALDVSTAYPWAIELTNGLRCVASYGGELFDNLPIRYTCGGESVLIGHLQRCKAEWTMLMRPLKGPVTTAVIKNAWF